MASERSLRTRIPSSEDKDDAIIQRIIEKVLSSDSLLDKICDKICANIIDTVKTAVFEKVYQEVEKQLMPTVITLQEQISSLKTELATKTDELESYSRRNNLRLYGLKELPNENTTQQFIQMCKDKMGLTINSDSIDCCHRLKSGKEGLKPIIIKFTQRGPRNLIFFNKNKLKGTSLVVREDLTKSKSDIYKGAVSKFGRKNVWTINSNIYASIQGAKILLSSVEDVNARNLNNFEKNQ